MSRPAQSHTLDREPIIRQFFITLFTPLARLMGRVHPNTITMISLVSGILAGLTFWLAHQHVAYYFVGAVLVAISGTADSLDGIVARMYGRTSKTGDFLDHFFDRVINVAIFAGLAFSPHATVTLGLMVVILTMLNSYLGTQIEATFGERYYGGLGKAELFVGLILGAVVLGIMPDTALAVAGRRFYLIDIFFVVLGLATLFGLAHRFHYALRLCAARREEP